MTQPSTPEMICPSCSQPAAGKFCSNCGASLEAATCAGCGAALSPGAKFCHKCGRSVGSFNPGRLAPTPKSSASSTPWIIAAVALVAILAYLAGSAFSRSRGSNLDAPQTALPQPGLDDRAQTGVIRAPDISQLSPEEQADRLFNRVMALNAQGKSDSVLFFAPMAIEAYRMLSPINQDQRYDLGRIAEIAGAYPLARSQADTILAQNPTSLLGLVLARRVASVEKRTADREKFDAKLLSVYASEAAKKLPGYDRHSADIQSALAEARKAGGK